jgi:hypothetical protein
MSALLRGGVVDALFGSMDSEAEGSFTSRPGAVMQSCN